MKIWRLYACATIWLLPKGTHGITIQKNSIVISIAARTSNPKASALTTKFQTMGKAEHSFHVMYQLLSQTFRESVSCPESLIGIDGFDILSQF
jgi:hypothetical protein